MPQKLDVKKSDMSTDLSEWITQKEAAELLNKSLQSVYQLVKNNRIRNLEIFGKRLVSQQDILNFKPIKGGRPKKR